MSYIKHAQSKCEEFPVRRSAAILSSLTLRVFFYCSMTRMDQDTRLHNSKCLIAWIILSYVIFSALEVCNISLPQHWQSKEIAFENHQFWPYV